jgi:CMP-N-acetylneuraminic acid synthetase
MAQEILAIIPARGGSKRLPRKNIKLLLGKPMIYYTLDAAFKSKYINRTVVSTEDKEIAEVVIKYGTEVIQRPKNLAEDDSSVYEVINHVLARTEADIVVLLQPTSPLRIAKDLDEAISIFLKGDCDAVIGYTKNQIPNGAVYVSKVNYLKKYKNFYAGRIRHYIMPDERSVDIDTLEQFKHAETILSHSRGRRKF